MALGSHDRSPTTECDEPVRILSDEVESLAHLWDDIPPAKSLETGSLNSLYPCVPIGTACVRFLAPEHDVKILDAAVLQVNITGLTGRFTSSNTNLPGCRGTGWFGGLVVTNFLTGARWQRVPAR